VAADDEAAELMAAANGHAGRLDELVTRRCAGEPVAWLVGSVQFCGETVLVQPGVYVPRWQSEPMALEAVARLPQRGVAVDLCTGSGAIALVMSRRRPNARVLASERDPRAAACARANGIEVYEGDMALALPASLGGMVDVVTAVPPYVPTDALRLLPRDVVAFEPPEALDGGGQGTTSLCDAVRQAAPLLRSGGSLLLEVGGDQDELLGPVLEECGYGDMERHVDEDGDLRAVFCRRH
jgi:release factor glutamine methyltransferase